MSIHCNLNKNDYPRHSHQKRQTNRVPLSDVHVMMSLILLHLCYFGYGCITHRTDKTTHFPNLFAYYTHTRLGTYCANFKQHRLLQFECCGTTNYTDFAVNATKWNSTYTVGGVVVNAVVPPMCCTMKDHSDFPGHIEDVQFVDLQGCLAGSHPNATNTKVRDVRARLL